MGTAIRTEAFKHYHANQLVHVAEVLCTDSGVNHIDVTGDSDITGPIVYLLKLLVRKYGTDCLQRVSKDHQWVVPPPLRPGQEVRTLCYVYTH